MFDRAGLICRPSPDPSLGRGGFSHRRSKQVSQAWPSFTILARIRNYHTGHFSGMLLEGNGEADHMHLLVELPPTVPLSTFVNNLKTVSSRLLRKAYGQELSRWYRQPVLWSRSYCVLSCGDAPLSVLRQYIEQQGTSAS